MHAYSIISTQKEQLDDISIEKVNIKLNYLGIDGSVKSRHVEIVAPVDQQGKLPLIFNIHYELFPQEKLVYECVKRGWAILLMIDIPLEHLSNILDDDLRFNMAVMDLTRRLEFIDHKRIGLRGLSAGGYQNLVLSTTRIGILCSYIICGIPNIVYLCKYLQMNRSLGLENITKIAGIADLMEHSLGELETNRNTWLAYSPSAQMNNVNHPTMLLHSTADLPIPLHVWTHSHAYAYLHEDIHTDYRIRLIDVVKDDAFNKSIEEVVTDLDIYRFDLDQIQENPHPLQFMEGRRFSLNVMDEGILDKKCDHFKLSEHFFMVSELAFFEHYFESNAADTNILTFSKLEMLADRYMGKLELSKKENPFKSVCDQNIFGSLASDRLDVLKSMITYLGYDGYNACHEDNLHLFMKMYSKLAPARQFLNKEKANVINGSYSLLEQPLLYLTTLLKHYENGG